MTGLIREANRVLTHEQKNHHAVVKYPIQQCPHLADLSTSTYTREQCLEGFVTNPNYSMAFGRILHAQATFGK